MNENLQRFLTEWLEWAGSGAPDKQPFTRRYGLCSNLNAWSRTLDDEVRAALERELDAIFIADGLDMCHPFGPEQYFWARDREVQHLDERRLAWVRSKVEQFATANAK